MNGIICDCLYPQWKKTCQTYCMDNQFYEIQLNQCYSLNPDQLKCKCSGRNLTDKIKNLIEKNNTISTSTSHSTISEIIQCLPSSSCSIGQMSCYGTNTYCTCDQGQWKEMLCPKEKICQIKNNRASCQSTSSINEQIQLDSIANSIQMNKFVFVFIVISLKNRFSTFCSR